MLEVKQSNRYYMLKGLDGKWSIHTSLKLHDVIKKDLTEEEALMWLKLLKEN